MRRFFLTLAPFFAAVPLLLNSYAAWWALQYRLPPANANQLVDRRACSTDSSNSSNSSERPRYITFCAALANNPHGFPGHALVVWSETADWNRPDSQTAGFVPRYSIDQFASLFTNVPGLMVDGHAGEMVNPDAITVVITKKEYERTLKLRNEWNSSKFRTGLNDCVAFVDFIAQDVGLVTPAEKFTFPQDHIKQLKLLNNKSVTRLARSIAPLTRRPGQSASNSSGDFDHAD